MTCAEHYFENLLIYGKDVADDVNKKNISEIEQKTIEMCAQYVIYTLFDGRADFDRYYKESVGK